jgi:hypothetical protein
MTSQRPDRHMKPVDAPPRGRPVPSRSGTSARWPARVRRVLITAGAATASGVLGVTVRPAAQSMLIAVVVLVVVVVACTAAVVMYQARQETQRKQLDVEPLNKVAHAVAGVVQDVHRHADDPADKDSVAEAKRVRDSAQRFLADHAGDLARLTERPSS